MQENTTRHAEVRHRLVCACARARTHAHTHKHARAHTAESVFPRPLSARSRNPPAQPSVIAPLPPPLPSRVPSSRGCCSASPPGPRPSGTAPRRGLRVLSAGEPRGARQAGVAFVGAPRRQSDSPGRRPFPPRSPPEGGFTQLPPRFKEGAEVNCKDSVPRQRFLTCRQHPAGRLDPGGDCV